MNEKRRHKMKNVNQVFTDEEFQALQSAKGNKNWHDFIMELAKPQTHSFSLGVNGRMNDEEQATKHSYRKLPD